MTPIEMFPKGCDCHQFIKVLALKLSTLYLVNHTQSATPYNTHALMFPTYVSDWQPEQSLSVVVGRGQALGLFKLFVDSANFVGNFMTFTDVTVCCHTSYHHLKIVIIKCILYTNLFSPLFIFKFVSSWTISG